MTSLIYSLTLGTIIFLLVSATLQLKIVAMMSTLAEGDLILSGGRIKPETIYDEYLFSSDSDPVLITYKDKIRDFGYTTDEVSLSQNGEADTCFSDRARMMDGLAVWMNRCTSVQAVPPSTLLDKGLDLEYFNKTTGLSPTE